MRGVGILVCMEVALVQYDIAWEDKAANHARIEAMLDEAGLQPGTFVLLPELGDTGFTINPDVHRNEEHDSMAWARALAHRLDITIQVGHGMRQANGTWHNCATIVGPQGELATYAKIHPMRMLGEHRFFAGGESLLVTDIGPLQAAAMICYDLRFGELFRLAAMEGAELFAIGACWPSERIAHWRALLVARAIEGQAWVLGCNRVGSDPNLDYGGTSIVIAPDGTVLAEADASQEIVLKATLDVDWGRKFREQFPFLKDMRQDLLGTCPVVRD